MIGVFDSGVGGLSVWSELVKLLPKEEYIYVADSGNCPYGPKSKGEIIERADAITSYLLSEGATIIVIACNTATAAAIEYLRAKYSAVFVGMEPAVKPAALKSLSGVIGVLATKGTFSGELYHNTLNKFAQNVKVIEQVGEGLVELVESGETNSDEALILISSYVQPMVNNGADVIVLGCTHYPFLIDTIKRVVNSNVDIINPAPAVAKRVAEFSSKESTITRESTTFITTGNNLVLIKQMVSSILNCNTYNSVFMEFDI